MQRAWRRVLANKHKQQEQTRLISNLISSKDKNSVVSEPKIAWTMSVSPQTQLPCDNDKFNVDSDYTEMAGPVKEHLANLQYLQQSETSTSGGIMDDNQLIEVDDETHNLLRNSDETEDEFNRRLRKVNLLSLAHEFAALKADGPKIQQHQDHSPMSEVSTDSESEDDIMTSSSLPNKKELPLKQKEAWSEKSKIADPPKSSTPKPPENDKAAKTPSSEQQDFDVYNIESTMPEVMDWTYMEQQLKKAAEEQQMRQVCCWFSCIILDTTDETPIN